MLVSMYVCYIQTSCTIFHNCNLLIYNPILLCLTILFSNMVLHNTDMCVIRVLFPLLHNKPFVFVNIKTSSTTYTCYKMDPGLYIWNFHKLNGYRSTQHSLVYSYVMSHLSFKEFIDCPATKRWAIHDMIHGEYVSTTWLIQLESKLEKHLTQWSHNCRLSLLATRHMQMHYHYCVLHVLKQTHT